VSGRGSGGGNGRDDGIGRHGSGSGIAGIAIVALLLGLAGCALPHWPVDGPITSPYGIRFRGILPSIHEGVDIRVPVGTPIAAMKAGTVAFAGTLGDYGLVVILDHGGHTRSLYGHLSRIDVQPGERVEGGQRIGLSGQSGNASGPHLHFEILRRGRPEDPVPLLGGRPKETGGGSRP
jgi:murein DD-endopeptidase MepM/ murein hydrolase activator NlpD